MTTQNNQLQMLYLMDRDLLFFSTDEHTQLGILEEKHQRQLGKLVKKVIQEIHLIKKHSQHNDTGASDSSYSLAHKQQTLIYDFFQQKHTQQLYIKLKDIKHQYQELIQDQQIRILENDMERYQQLQRIRSISSRLDVYNQVYDELNHLHRALSSIRRNWKLEAVQQVVNNIVAPTLPSPTSTPTPTPTPTPSPSPSPLNISNYQKYYRPNTSFLSFFKRSSNHPSPSLTATTVEKNDRSMPSQYHYKGHHHRHQHPHLLCANQEQGRHLIMQIIQDFQNVFEENVYQNEQRMYQLHTHIFQQYIDPMLAHDIQHLYLSVCTASPPSLTSLTPSGISSVCSWTSETTRALFFNTQHQCPIDFNHMIQYTGDTKQHHHQQQQQQQQRQRQRQRPLLSRFLLSNRSALASRLRKQGVKWIDSVLKKRQQQCRHQQQPDHPCTPCQDYYFQQHEGQASESSSDISTQQQQMWSVCLRLLSEHLLYVGQQYYTQWIKEISQCQDKQIAPFQLATETMASTYRALQIEHGYSILARLCLQMESIGI